MALYNKNQHDKDDLSFDNTYVLKKFLGKIQIWMYDLMQKFTRIDF